MGNMEVPGRRAAVGGGPYGGLSIEGQSRKKADIHPLPPDERQRKEELVHSSRNKPPLNPIARGKSFRLRRSFSRAPSLSRPGERAIGNMEVPGRRAAEGGDPYGVFYR